MIVWFIEDAPNAAQQVTINTDFVLNADGNFQKLTQLRNFAHSADTTTRRKRISVLNVEPHFRKHGIIQLAIFGFYIVILAALFATGNLPADALTNYQQLILGNTTLP